MNILKNTLSICLLLVATTWANAQIKFKLSLLEDGKTYQVSMLPEVTFKAPLNLTSTGQVTIKVPSKGFAVDQIFNLQAEVIWEPNSLTEAPSESPDFDYISFGLVSQGTKNIKYETDVEIPLFAFTNFLECQGEIALIDNLTDPFAPPNSKQVNVGNQLTVLGAQGDAYIGNTIEDKVPCAGYVTTIENINASKINLSLFPNPTSDYLAANFDWNRKGETAQLMVLDMSGKSVMEQEITINQGVNQTRLEVQNLAQGNYFLEITGSGWKITSEQFVKMLH